MDEDLVAFTPQRVTRLTGLSRRQIDRWARTHLLEPTVDEHVTPHRSVRLYGYQDLMSLLVIVELRRRVSPRAVRAVVERVRTLNFEPNQVRFAVVGNGVCFQGPDGVWEDGLKPGQRVFEKTLDLRPIRAVVKRAAQRHPDQVGKVERRRGALGSKPLMAGTRIPVAAIQRYLERGATVAEVLEAYPALRPADVKAARTHAA